ncbi:hypothetical protein Plec18170_009706 [Paecilomyces lecythidis]
MANEEPHLGSARSAVTPIPEDWIADFIDPALIFPPPIWNEDGFPDRYCDATDLLEDLPLENTIADIPNLAVPSSEPCSLNEEASIRHTIHQLSRDLADTQKTLQDVQGELSQRKEE